MNPKALLMNKPPSKNPPSYGQERSDSSFKHPANDDVRQILFVPEKVGKGGEDSTAYPKSFPQQGELITVCGSASLFQWRWSEEPARLIHSLQLKHEKSAKILLLSRLAEPGPSSPSHSIAVCALPPGGGTWIYVGTDRGNVFVYSTDALLKSSYEIYWNKITEK